MRVCFLPETRAGKLSAWLIVGFILLLALFFVLVAAGQRGGEGFFDNLLLTVPMLIAGTCAIVSLVVGIVGVVKSRERSVIVYVAMLIGLLVLFWVIAELAFPH
jgi:hypothetical protein